MICKRAVRKNIIQSMKRMVVNLNELVEFVLKYMTHTTHIHSSYYKDIKRFYVRL